MTTRTPVGGGGTLNLGDGPANVKINGILSMVAIGGVTLLGMQEGSDRVQLLKRLLEILRHPAAAARRAVEGRRARRELREILERARWRIYHPFVPGGKAVPVAWDASVWKLRRARTILAVARAWVGAVGAGPTWAKPKVITVVVLEHRETGHVIEHLNTHMIPSADRENLPAREKAARRRHYRKHAERLARAVHRAVRRGHGVVVTLDANATRNSELIEPLRAAGLRGWTTHGTKGARGIDHVLTLGQSAERGDPAPLLVGAPAEVITLRGFDHRGVIRPLYVKAG